MKNKIKYLNLENIDNLSYNSKLGKSLDNKISKFDKDDLVSELIDIIKYYSSTNIENDDNMSYRVKSLHSCLIKYNKNYPSSKVKNTFNDLLGIRYIVNDYSDIDISDLPVGFRVVDMTKGKSNDDGYRGFHVYYNKSNFHYPIEIQFFTNRDKIFNEWLHNYVYKYTKNKEIGVKLKEKYENNIIYNEESFRREFNVLYNSEKF